MRGRARGKAGGPLPRRITHGLDPLPQRRNAPQLSELSLINLGIALRHSAIEPSTRRGYSTALNHWNAFATLYSYPHIPNATTLPLFVAYLSTHTIAIPAVLSGLAFHFRPHVTDWNAMRSSFDVQQTIKGAAKTSQHVVHRSPPLLPHHLDQFARHALRPCAAYDDALALFIAAVGMGGLLRLGEMVEPEHREDRSPRKHVLRESATLTPSVSFSFNLPYHKADNFYEGSFVHIVAEASPCSVNIVHLLELYIRKRDARHGQTGCLFLREDGSIPTRRWFLARLRVIAPGISGHGLRAGGATWLASVGVSPELIRRWGRWSSDAWEIYIRSHPAIYAALQLRARLSPPVVVHQFA
jgi:hypothetical protein